MTLCSCKIAHIKKSAFYFGTDCFTENFQVKENKTKMRNIHPRIFDLLFWGLRLGFGFRGLDSFRVSF